MVLVLGVAFVLSLTYLVYVKVADERATNRQIVRLDGAYSSLNGVLDLVSRSHDGILEKKVGKGCGQASAIGGGVITCGSYLNIMHGVDSVTQYDSFVMDILTSVSEKGFEGISKSSGISALEGVPVTAAKFTHSSTSVPCTFSAGLYDQGQYRKRFGEEPPKLEQPFTRYVVAHIDCDEPTDKFLPGYPVEK